MSRQAGRARREGALSGAGRAAPRPTLLILVKEPRPGRVKTRLARETGAVAAAWWLRHQLARLVRRVGRDTRWRTVLAVSPDGAVRAHHWPAGPARIPQGGGDLGRRMARALASVPRAPAVLVGADIPGIRARHIARAFALLGRHEAVLGPAEDGGYWLVGFRRGALAARPDVFAGVRWSSPHALADTRASLGPLRVGLADRLADVDGAADLARARREAS